MGWLSHELQVTSLGVGPGVLRDDAALVAGHDHRVRLVRGDPRLVVVVAARRAADDLPGVAAVPGAGDDHVGHVDEVRVLRVDHDVLEVPAAPPQPGVVGELRPVRAAVVGAEEAALPGGALAVGVRARLRRRRAGRRLQVVDHGVDAVRLAGAHGDPAPAHPLRRQAVGQLLPGVAAVGGLVDAAAGPVGGRVHEPRRPARIPEAGVHLLGFTGSITTSMAPTSGFL